MARVYPFPNGYDGAYLCRKIQMFANLKKIAAFSVSSRRRVNATHCEIKIGQKSGLGEKWLDYPFGMGNGMNAKITADARLTTRCECFAAVEYFEPLVSL